MFSPKIAQSLKITSAIGLILLGGWLIATPGFSAKAEEKLYPVEDFTKINPPLVLANEPRVAANPFIPDLPEIPKVERPLESPATLAGKFDARSLKVELLGSDSGIESVAVENCKALLEKTLNALPVALTDSLDAMKLFFTERTQRGLSNAHLVELRCGKLDDDEIVSVFVHELGHVVDLGKLKGVSLAPSGFVDGAMPIPADDPSIEFYKLSWQDAKTQKYLAERNDFVSGYAMTDPFEDFAESFNFYVLHGADFRGIAQESSVLAAKYDFLKNQVFDGVEFSSQRETSDGKRVWDATLIKFDQTEFFGRQNH